MIIYILFLFFFAGLVYKASGSTTEDNIKARSEAADARRDRNKEKNAQTRKDIVAVAKFIGGGDKKKKKSGWFS